MQKVHSASANLGYITTSSIKKCQVFIIGKIKQKNTMKNMEEHMLEDRKTITL